MIERCERCVYQRHDLSNRASLSTVQITSRLTKPFKFGVKVILRGNRTDLTLLDPRIQPRYAQNVSRLSMYGRSQLKIAELSWYQSFLAKNKASSDCRNSIYRHYIYKAS